MDPLRIGVLGTARITPSAVLAPAHTLADVEVVAVASRDRERARAFAATHGIARSYGSYDALLADPEVDAVYNPLPNGLHGRWTLAAADAGKHVLCEKPFAANAEEAESVGRAVDRAGVVVMEGFHDCYHPLAARMREIVASGTLGAVRHLSTRMVVVVAPRRRDLRYRVDLAGGAVMDVGCYAIHQLRMLAGAEPIVTRARAKQWPTGIDRWMGADLAFADGRTGRVTCGMFCAAPPLVDVRVVGEDGMLHVWFPNRPQIAKGLVVRRNDGSKTHERVTGHPAHWYQLRAFAGAVQHGDPVMTPVSDAIANLRVIDAVYEAAGLPRREPSSDPTPP